MDREELKKITHSAGSADNFDMAETLAIEALRRSLELIENIRANRAKYPDGMIRSYAKYDYVDGKFDQVGETDYTFSDQTILLAGDLEAIAYRLRIDAGIWPSNVKFTTED